MTGGGQAGDKSGGGSERFFVLTRRGGKTLGIEDYGTLTEARSARQRLEESNPDVDYPLVAAPDEATLFAVFPEYRQEEDEGAEETKAAPVEKSYERYVPRFRRPA